MSQHDEVCEHGIGWSAPCVDCLMKQASTKAKATYRNPNGDLKPRKHGPKQFKRGPGPEGKARLEQRLSGLAVAASRLARTAESVDDREWADRLVEAIRLFHAQEFARSGPRFSVTEMLQKK